GRRAPAEGAGPGRPRLTPRLRGADLRRPGAGRRRPRPGTGRARGPRRPGDPRRRPPAAARRVHADPRAEQAPRARLRDDRSGGPPRGLVRALREGVELEDGPARADRARVLAQDGREAMVEVTLHEGRNRIVRRMFASQGFELTALVRTRIGPVLLGDLAPGR